METTNQPTNHDLRCLIRDYKLPIAVPRTDQILHFIELFDHIHKTKEKYNWLLQAINNPNVSSIDNYGKMLADQIGNDIKANIDAMKNLESDKKYVIPKDNIFPQKQDPYDKRGGYPDEKVFISIDIIKANFTALKFFDPELVSKCNTWEDLIGKHTDIQYFIQSKHFRQVVFGKIGSIMKKVTSLQKYLTNELYVKLKDTFTVISVTSDEIIMESARETYVNDIARLNLVLDNFPENMRNIWKAIPFSLVSIGKSKAIKHTNLSNNQISIRGICYRYHPQIVRYINGDLVQDEDLMFVNDENVLCSFIERIKF